MTGVGACDVAFGEAVRVVGQQGEMNAVVAATKLADIIEEYWHIVFATEMLGTEKERSVDA